MRKPTHRLERPAAKPMQLQKRAAPESWSWSPTMPPLFQQCLFQRQPKRPRSRLWMCNGQVPYCLDETECPRFHSAQPRPLPDKASHKLTRSMLPKKRASHSAILTAQRDLIIMSISAGCYHSTTVLTKANTNPQPPQNISAQGSQIPTSKEDNRRFLRNRRSKTKLLQLIFKFIHLRKK